VGKTSTTTKTRVTKLTREQVTRALNKARLTPEEENVVRLRYGIGVSPDQKLEFRGRDNEELSIRLAMLEKELLERLESAQDNQKDPAHLDDILKDI